MEHDREARCGREPKKKKKEKEKKKNSQEYHIDGYENSTRDT